MDFNVSNYTGPNPNLTDSGPRVLGYSSGDYLWSKATDESYTCTAKSTQCTVNTLDCYKTTLCNNKLLSQELDQQQLTHSGADGRYTDTKAAYNINLLTTVNLSLGIIYIGIFVYYRM